MKTLLKTYFETFGKAREAQSDSELEIKTSVHLSLEDIGQLMLGKTVHQVGPISSIIIRRVPESEGK